MSKSPKISPQANKPTKTGKKPHPTEPPQEQARQPVPYQRERQDATSGTAALKPTKTDETETSSDYKNIINLKRAECGSPQRTRKNPSGITSRKTSQCRAPKHITPPMWTQQAHELSHLQPIHQRQTRRSSQRQGKRETK
jgi:hypothetical protein